MAIDWTEVVGFRDGIKLNNTDDIEGNARIGTDAGILVFLDKRHTVQRKAIDFLMRKMVSDEDFTVDTDYQLKLHGIYKIDHEIRLDGDFIMG